MTAGILPGSPRPAGSAETGGQNPERSGGLVGFTKTRRGEGRRSRPSENQDRSKPGSGMRPDPSRREI